MKTIVLPFADWPLIAPIYQGPEFQNSLPVTPEQATFPAIVDGEKIAAFMLVEHLYHFNAVYVYPEYRGQALAQRLIRDAVTSIPPGHSAIWMTDSQHPLAAKRMGARDLGLCQVYRKDVL
jgi:GNAT superfamily N-acetyltransferase